MDQIVWGCVVLNVKSYTAVINFFIVLQELSADVLKERKALIRKLQTQLRNEEMSLVLLKKIRQSQVMAEQAKAAEAAKVSIQPTSRQSHTNQGTPPPQAGHGHNLASTGSKNRPGGAQSSAASISNARSGGGQNMKNILTPDLSILKPVSAVSILFCKCHIPFTFVQQIRLSKSSRVLKLYLRKENLRS